MQSRVSLLLLVLVGLLLTGCTARPDAGLTAAAGASGLVLDLPAITVEYDSSGTPVLAGVTAEELAAVLPGGIDRLRLPSTVIEVARNAGIQHVQVSNTPGGLRFFVNGAALPGLAWDAPRLQNTAVLAEQFGFSLPPEVAALLPILPQLGVGVTVRFPLADDATPIPPAAADPTGAGFQAQQQEALAAAGSRPVLRIPITYRENGSFLINGVTDAELQQITQLPWGALRLNEQTLADLRRAGIDQIDLLASVDGLHVDLNGKPLPYLAWNRGEVGQTLALAEELGVLGALRGASDAPDPIALLTPWLPLLQATDIAIHVRLPD